MTPLIPVCTTGSNAPCLCIRQGHMLYHSCCAFFGVLLLPSPIAQFVTRAHDRFVVSPSRPARPDGTPNHLTPTLAHFD